MPFQGTFDVLDFAQVLSLVATQGMTGKLRVRSRSMGANLLFEDGQLVGADQSDHSTSATVGDVQGRVEEVCFGLLEAERGAFEFHPNERGQLPVTTTLDVAVVLERARHRLQEWREIQLVIPSLDLQPRLALELEKDVVSLDRGRWRVLTAIDGRRSLRAIGRLLALSDFDVCRLSLSLLDDGVIELEGRGVHHGATRAGVGEDGDRQMYGSTPAGEGQVGTTPDRGPIAAVGGMTAIDPPDDEEHVVTIVSSVAGASTPDSNPGPEAATEPAASELTGDGSIEHEADHHEPGADPPVNKPRRLVRIRSRSV